MSKINLKKIIVILNVFIVLLFINYSIYKNESILNYGQVVRLAIKPIDPRSLIQGDYMHLSFEEENHVQSVVKSSSSSGKIVFSLDNNKILKFERVFKEGETLNSQEVFIKYKIVNGLLDYAPNAFFFQDGKDKDFEQAKYAEFKLLNGNLILVDLLNEIFQNLSGKK